MRLALHLRAPFSDAHRKATANTIRVGDSRSGRGADDAPTPHPYPYHPQSTAVRSVQPNQEILTPALKSRAEIEDVYGSPLPAILLSLMFLQRLGAALLSLGLTLVLGSRTSRPCVRTGLPPPF